MLNKLMIIQDEIEEELTNIDNLITHIHDIQNNNFEKEIEKRLTASILDDFYLATERIFKTISRDIDNELPEGEEWHKKLLRSMTIELPETRPAVINKELFYQLEEYLRFRHLVRNIYGFQLEVSRFNHLIQDIDQITRKLENQVMDFLGDMKEIAKVIDGN